VAITFPGCILAGNNVISSIGGELEIHEEEVPMKNSPYWNKEYFDGCLGITFLLQISAFADPLSISLSNPGFIPGGKWP